MYLNLHSAHMSKHYFYMSFKIKILNQKLQNQAQIWN